MARRRQFSIELFLTAHYFSDMLGVMRVTTRHVAFQSNLLIRRSIFRRIGDQSSWKSPCECELRVQQWTECPHFDGIQGRRRTPDSFAYN
jgi:hypothetical protein